MPPRPWEREHPFAVILLETVTILALVFLALITSGVLVGCAYDFHVLLAHPNRESRFFERGNRFSILVLLSYAAFVTSFLLLGRRYLSTFHTSMDDCPSETPITIYITTATIFESNPYAIATAVLFYDQSRVAFTLERVGPEFALVLADLPGFNITFDFFRRTARDSWYGMTAELPASASEQMRIHTPFSHAELVEYDGGGVDGNGVPISLRPPRFILVDQTPGWGARHLVFRTYGPRRHRTLKVCIAQWNAKWRADLRTAFSAFVPLGFTMYHHSQSYEHDWLFKS